MNGLLLSLCAVLLVVTSSTAALAQGVGTMADSVRNVSEQMADALRKNDFNHAAELGQRLISLGKRDCNVFYATAMTLLLTGRRQDAVQYLDTAAQLGWSEPDKWETNPLLSGLKGDSVFDHALVRVRENASLRGTPSTEEKGNPFLERLFMEDQGDRMVLLQHGLGAIPPDSAAALTQRDRRRLEQVRTLVEAGVLKLGIDYQRAATVFQHGKDSADFRTAYELASKAVALGQNDARGLAAASLDRYLISVGKPQKFGTQWRKGATGEIELYPVDPMTTDEERAIWGIAPLETLRKQARNMKQLN